MNVLQKKLAEIPFNLRLCFSSGVVFGLLTHLFMMTNKLSNWDDVTNFSSYGVGGELGRWVLRFVHPLAGRLSNPWVNGSMAILLLSVAACLIYEILQLRSRLSAVLLPMIFMTFPSLASTMTFMFTVDLYAIGVLLAVLSAYLAVRFRYGFLWGMVPLIFSLGIYQAYVCFPIALLLLRWIGDELTAGERGEHFDAAATARRAFSYIVLVLAGTIIYMVIAHLRYPLLSSETHNGVGEMGKLNVLRLPVYCAKAYLRLLNYFVLGGYSFQTAFMKLVNVLTVAAILIMLVLLLRRARIWRSRARGAWTFLLLLVFPVAVSFTDVMSPDAYFSMVMLYAFCLVYMLPLWLGERLERSTEKEAASTRRGGQAAGQASAVKTVRAGEAEAKTLSGANVRNGAGRAGTLASLLSLAGVVLILCSSFGDYVVSGEAYFRMKISYERVYGYFDRMLARVEAQPDYDADAPLYVLGTFDGETMTGYPLEEERFLDFSGVALEYGLITPGTRENFLRIYLGKPVENSMSEAGEALRQSEAYQAMADYPSDGSIRQIDGAWVVRISE